MSHPIALITGASSGLGKEFSYIHAKTGGDLVLVARRSEKLESIKGDIEQKYDVSVTIISKDLTLENAVEEIYDELNEKNIKVEYLINNAGFGGIGTFGERDWESESSMIDLNVVALTKLCHKFLPIMKTRNSGKILNISSTASLLPGPNQAIYYATKAFVTSFSNAISEELHDSNVSVTTLLPGPTDTEFGSVSGMNKTSLFKNTASPFSVAIDGYNAMIDGKLNIISGVSLPQKIIMKIIPFLPKKMLLKIVRKGQETQ